MKIELCNGKYTYVLDDDFRQYALRYGEHWRDLVGDGLVLAMAQRIEDLEEALEELTKTSGSAENVKDAEVLAERVRWFASRSLQKAKEV